MPAKPGKKVSLKQYNPDDTGSYRSSDEADDILNKQLEELTRLQNLLYAEDRHAVLIILQGMDTSGKDGTIRHVMSGLSPLGVRVTAFKEPTKDELAHDFFWRAHQAAPAFGTIGIFNRSYYEDVLVVRVHELVPKKVWKDRYQQINHFEKILVDNGTIILKFFLHISRDEQKKRLEERIHEPTRYWKFSKKDVEERQFWSAYRKAYEAVLSKCSTSWAPWHIVPANHKWYRNLFVAERLVHTLQELDMKYPAAAVDLSQVVID